MSQKLNRAENLLLAALPIAQYERVLPHLEPVALPLRQILYNPGEPIEYVYFPHRAVISLVTILEDGATIESGLVGSEGIVGVDVFLGNNRSRTQAIVQIEGEGVRLPAAQLKAEFDRGEVLQSLLLRYLQVLMVQLSQGGACNRLHTVEERFSRWILMASDRIGSNDLLLTQEFIAQMIGTRRAGVTVAAGTLQQAGLINYRRGRITILDRENLEAASCECYWQIQAAFNEFVSLVGASEA